MDLVFISSSRKGVQEVASSWIKTPSAQRSISFVQATFSAISGAKQTTVPACVLVFSSPWSIFDSPKSASFTQPSSKINTFSGFKSRYRISFLCRCSKAKTTAPATNLTPSSPNSLNLLALSFFLLPLACLMVSSVSADPPCAYSMARQTQCWLWKEYFNLVINSCFISISIDLQMLILCFAFLLRMFLVLMHLRAQRSGGWKGRPGLGLARQTPPKLPRPRRPRISKSEI